MKIFALVLVVVVAAFAGIDRDDHDDYTGSINSDPSGSIGSWDYPRDVLYDNGPFVTGVGTGVGGADVSERNPGEETNGFGHQYAVGYKIADQFVIPAGETWSIESITVIGYQTGAGTTSTITGTYLCIYEGTPDAGTLVFGDETTNILTSTDWTNCYRCPNGDLTVTERALMANVCDITPLELGEGEYWMAWQLDGSTSSGPWANPVTIAGQGNTGDALQYMFETFEWVPALMGGTDTPVGIPFILEGSTVGSLSPSSWAAIKTSF